MSTTRPPASGGARVTRPTLLGVALCVIIAALATAVGRALPVVGAPVLGLVIGVAVRLSRPTVGRLSPGIAVCNGIVLQVAVAMLGLQLTLGSAVSTGVHSLPVLVGTLVICLVAAAALGAAMRVRPALRTLVGVGTAICGASAIAAVTPVIEAEAVDVAYALSTVFLFNVVAVVVFPLLGHALGMSQQAFGLFAGTAINDTSSVVAAGYVYGTAAVHHAVAVKLTRTLFIIPICIGLAVGRGRGRAAGHRLPPITRLVPWFLVAFVFASTLVSVLPPPPWLRADLNAVSLFLITTALAAVGLSTNVGGLRRTGPRPFLLGAALWVIVCLASLGIAAASGLR